MRPIDLVLAVLDRLDLTPAQWAAAGLVVLEELDRLDEQP